MQLSDRALALIAAQRDRYLSALPDRRDRLKTLWQNLLSARSTDALLEEFKRSIHKLAGSAGNFELLLVSDMARQLERRIEEMSLDNIATAETEFYQLLESLHVTICSNS